MDSVSERSKAKLNLSLDVLSRREDGYHDLKMVMCSVEVWDDVTVELRRDGVCRAESNYPWLPGDQRNLAVKAAQAFFDALGEPNPGVTVRMKKRIPVGAGMAGGSANAAAVLRALNRLCQAGMTADELRRIGLTVGSDVPYCVEGGFALAMGRGEILTPLPSLPACHVVVAKPSFSVSTAELFHRLDASPLKTHPDTAGLLSAMENGDLPGMARRMYNVFEDVLPRASAEIRTIRSRLLDKGALGAVMTGTGSAAFGIFDQREAAEAAWSELRRRYRDCFMTSFAEKNDI